MMRRGAEEFDEQFTAFVRSRGAHHVRMATLLTGSSDAAEDLVHGLGDALSPGAHQAITEQTYDPVIGAISQLLDAGKRDGVIRADADPRDFLQLTGALWRAALGPEDRSQAMLGIILDGLAAADRSPG